MYQLFHDGGSHDLETRSIDLLETCHETVNSA